MKNKIILKSFAKYFEILHKVIYRSLKINSLVIVFSFVFYDAAKSVIKNYSEKGFTLYRRWKDNQKNAGTKDL